VVASLAHDQRDPGPQRAAGDLAGVLRIEPGAAQDLQGGLGGPLRRLVLLFVLEYQLGRGRVGAQHPEQGFQPALKLRPPRDR
jgi:hypothetical protein